MTSSNIAVFTCSLFFVYSLFHSDFLWQLGNNTAEVFAKLQNFNTSDIHAGFFVIVRS